MAITYRLVKGSALTFAELDDNFTTLVTSLASVNTLIISLDTEVAMLQSEVAALQAGPLAGYTSQSYTQSVSVDAVSGTATLVPSHTGTGITVLQVSTSVNPTDVYDIELYDGTVAGNVLLYKAQQVTGNYLDNVVFFQDLVNTLVTVRLTNLRQDAAPFTASVTVKAVWT